MNLLMAGFSTTRHPNDTHARRVIYSPAGVVTNAPDWTPYLRIVYRLVAPATRQAEIVCSRYVSEREYAQAYLEYRGVGDG